MELHHAGTDAKARELASDQAQRDRGLVIGLRGREREPRARCAPEYAVVDQRALPRGQVADRERYTRARRTAEQGEPEIRFAAVALREHAQLDAEHCAVERLK